MIPGETDRRFCSTERSDTFCKSPCNLSPLLETNVEKEAMTDDAEIGWIFSNDSSSFPNGSFSTCSHVDNSAMAGSSLEEYGTSSTLATCWKFWLSLASTLFFRALSEITVQYTFGKVENIQQKWRKISYRGWNSTVLLAKVSFNIEIFTWTGPIREQFWRHKAR